MPPSQWMMKTLPLSLLYGFQAARCLDPNDRQELSPFESITTSFEREFISEWSGRRFLAAVVTLDSSSKLRGRSGRLYKFAKAWHKSWPGLHFKRQAGFINHPALMSYGLLASFHAIFADAIDYSGKFDYLLVFEDDALPFAKVTWPPIRNNDLEKRLDLLEKANGGGLVLGGHRFQGYNKTNIKENVQGITQGFNGYGSYAFVVPWKVVRVFKDTFHKSLMKKRNSRGVADGRLWTALKTSKGKLNTTGGYISIPLMVDHDHGFSQTWRSVKRRRFEGHRKFWKFKD
eukprot:scaffold1_cov375-Pavlova_lutheri.AAC.35